MLYEIYEDVAFNVTYTYTDYRDLSTLSNDTIMLCEGTDVIDNVCNPTGTLSNNSQADMSDNRVLFGVNYFL